MAHYSTREAARKLGLGHATLARYIKSGKVPPPKTVITSNAVTHLWTQEEIEKVRRLLPTIQNGRSLRHKKQKKQMKKAQTKKK